MKAWARNRVDVMVWMVRGYIANLIRLGAIWMAIRWPWKSLRWRSLHAVAARRAATAILTMTI